MHSPLVCKPRENRYVVNLGGNEITLQEYKERCADLWHAHKILEQQRQTIDPYQTPSHGKMWDAVVETQKTLEEFLMP